jgi:predicted nuclease of predicted toxin-antitoxin system
MPKILVDENLPASIVVAFGAQGLEALHVSMADLKGASEDAIWKYCLDNNLAIARKDTDYLELSHIRGDVQVILFAVGNMRLREILKFGRAKLVEIEAFLASSDRVLILKA